MGIFLSRGNVPSSLVLSTALAALEQAGILERQYQKISIKKDSGDED